MSVAFYCRDTYVTDKKNLYEIGGLLEEKEKSKKLYVICYYSIQITICMLKNVHVQSLIISKRSLLQCRYL